MSNWRTQNHSCEPIWNNNWHVDSEHTAEEGLPAFAAGFVMMWGAAAAAMADFAAGTHGTASIVQQGLHSPTTGAGMVTALVTELTLLPYAAARIARAIFGIHRLSGIDCCSCEIGASPRN
jgi:hypothetical protein